MTTLFLVLSIILLALGFFFALMPMFPVLPYMFLVVLGFGFATSFEFLDLNHYIIFALLMIVSVLVDHLSGVLGARYGGASRRALLVGIAAGILGSLIFPPFGGIVGVVGGVFITQLFHIKKIKEAFRTASYAFGGVLAGILANLLIVGVFITLFLVFVL